MMVEGEKAHGSASVARAFGLLGAEADASYPGPRQPAPWAAELREGPPSPWNRWRMPLMAAAAVFCVVLSSFAVGGAVAVVDYLYELAPVIF